MLQSVDKSKPKQGQEEELIAILNPIWSEGTRVEIFVEIPLNSDTHDFRIPIAGASCF